MTHYWTLLYDKDCRLCTQFSSWISRLDSESSILTLPYQEYILYNEHPVAEELEKDVHLIGRQGEVLKGGAVVQTVLAILPAMRPFRWMIEGAVGRKASDIAYISMKRFRDCPGCSRRKRR